MVALKVDENKIVDYVRKSTLRGNTLRIGALLEWMVEVFDIQYTYASSTVTKLCTGDKARLKKEGRRYIEVIK